MSSISVKNLVKIDAAAGAVAGFGLLILKNWLSPLLRLPESLLLAMAAIALCYALFSLFLSRLETPPRRLLRLLVFANFGYSLACLVLLAAFSSTASGWGVAYLLADAGIVGGLAFWESRVFFK